jgi:hypothetical protein
VAPAARCPFRVDLMEIPNIERIESPALHRSETGVLFVLPAGSCRHRRRRSHQFRGIAGRERGPRP